MRVRSLGDSFSVSRRLSTSARGLIESHRVVDFWLAIASPPVPGRNIQLRLRPAASGSKHLPHLPFSPVNDIRNVVTTLPSSYHRGRSANSRACSPI